MLSTLFTGFSLLLEYKIPILLFLTTTWAGGFILSKSIIMEETESFYDYIGVFFTGILVLSGTTFLLSFFSLLSPLIFHINSIAVLIISIIVIIKYGKAKIDLRKFGYWLGVNFLFISFLLIRLPYLKNILLPGYSDSPTHYQIIRQVLISPDVIHSNLSIKNIFNTYYHFGFHSLTAWVSVTSGLSIDKGMSLIGQVALALAPLSISFLTFTITKNKFSAFFSGMLAAFGWIMPAFGVNWGKFPALLSLSIIPAILGLIFQAPKGNKSHNIYFYAFLILTSTVVHTRVFILVLLAGTAIIAANVLNLPPKNTFTRSLIYSLLFLISMMPLLENLETFYNNVVVGAILFALVPFAFMNYPKQITAIFIFTTGLWGIKLLSDIPVNSITLLDEQFINLALFIPLSLLGGLGFAGTAKQFSQTYTPFLAIILAFFICYNSSWLVSLIPDPCCNYYTLDDERAFQWIQGNTKAEDLFIISTINDNQQHGTDAGIWIYSLTGRNTNKRLFNTNWSLQEGFPNSCNSGTDDIFIYTGGKPFSFSTIGLSQLVWMEKVFESGKTIIYKVVKCA